MFTGIRGNLWVHLSLTIGAMIAGVVSGTYGLVSAHIVTVAVAFAMCVSASVLIVVVTLWTALSPLRRLADAASAMSEGSELLVRSSSLNDIGRITRAIRLLQVSTQVAMSRMDGVDGSDAKADPTVGWTVVVIGSAMASRVGRAIAVTISYVVPTAVLASGMAVYMLAVPRKDDTPASVYRTAAADDTRITSPPLARGVTSNSITMGMSAPFSGSVRSLSDSMKLGIDTAFAQVNAMGGVHGRELKLIALDNGYDEKRAVETTRDLVENRHVFGLVGSVGTPTVKAVLPYLNQSKVLLFGPLTGSPVTRNDPPDRYVFNVRASYERETSAMVNYLVDVKHVPAKTIVVFAQNDSFGDAGYDGASKTIRKKGYSGELLRVGYDRNTVDVGEAVSRVLSYSALNTKAGGVRAVIVVATATASASFTARIASVGAIVLNVSFVDASQLALEFHDHYPGVGTGVIVTQVVPHFDSAATGVIRYREALKTFYPDKSPGFASLEGYVVGALFIEGLRRAGPDLTTERVIDALEKIQDLDLGTGVAFRFGVSRHQASQKVWGTELGANGIYKPLDTEWTE